MNLNRFLTITAVALGLLLAALCVYGATVLSQVPPFPVVEAVAGDTVLTNHVCPAATVGFLRWNPPTNGIAARYRVYAAANPATPFSNYQFYAEVPRTNIAIILSEQPQLFFCVSAVSSNGFESARATK